MIYVLDRVENIVGKKEKMLVSNISSFSYNVFKRLFFLELLNVWIVW